MAEFCLECWREIFDPDHVYNEKEFDYWDDLCEGCGEVKKCVDLLPGVSIYRKKSPPQSMEKPFKRMRLFNLKKC